MKSVILRLRSVAVTLRICPYLVLLAPAERFIRFLKGFICDMRMLLKIQSEKRCFHFSLCDDETSRAGEERV